MKRFISVVLFFVFVSALTGCNRSPDKVSSCKHRWDHIENQNEYTAADRCRTCGETRIYTDASQIRYSGPETGFRMVKYTVYWDGGMTTCYDLESCDVGYAMLECLSSLTETGETAARIAEDMPIDEHTRELPVESGTMWLECGSVGLFRISPDRSQICRVDSHLGEGKVLQMTDTLKSLINQAWSYPTDCWSGTYENGTVTLCQNIKGESAMESVWIEDLQIDEGGKDNKLTLILVANEDITTEVSVMAEASSDLLCGGDRKEVSFRKGKETRVELSFGGFQYGYSIHVTVDNTSIWISITP